MRLSDIGRIASCVCACLALAACSVNRTITITITARPPDAALAVDGVPVGNGEVVQKFVFNGPKDVHTVTATKPGYKDVAYNLTSAYEQDRLDLVLHPLTRKINFTVTPVPAIVKINGDPLSQDPVAQFSKVLEFTKDAKGAWTHYVVTAERPGFAAAVTNITWTDGSPDYVLALQPMRKDLKIATNPPGATIYVDDEVIGTSPVVDKARAFAYDADANQWIPRKVKAVKPGYDPVVSTISWDEGKTDYALDLAPKTKTIQFDTSPPGATVTIDGVALARSEGGVPTTQLSFPPTDEQGTYKTYVATVSKKTADAEWYPTTLPVSWDDGKTDYPVALKEVKTRPVPTLSVSIKRTDDGVWEVAPARADSIAWKDVTEVGAKEPVTQLYRAPHGTTVNSVAVSPDGSQILFVLLMGNDKTDLRSQILAIRPDGSGGVQQITDGRALDLMPSYTPEGDQIVFASNRAGKRLNVWQKSTVGLPGITQLTNADEHDLWPSLDAGAKARLFYEALVDGRNDPLLYMTRVGTTIRTDLSTIAVGQPRVSPKGDQILFTSANDKNGNRDLYVMPDKGGRPVNLTNTPDSDNYDAVWSRDGTQVAFVSDRGFDEERRHNPDLWIMDVAHPDKPTQITTNGSVDDSPAWDASGTAMYFRSNRGGEWGIWRISLK